MRASPGSGARGGRTVQSCQQGSHEPTGPGSQHHQDDSRQQLERETPVAERERHDCLADRVGAEADEHRDRRHRHFCLAAEMAAACESPNPATPVAISRPLPPSQFVSAVEIASAAPTTRTNKRAVFGENGRPGVMSACVVSRTLRRVKSPAYAIAASPDSTSDGTSIASVGMLTRPTTIVSCTTVATDDAAAPATAPPRSSGRAFAREPIAPIVAVLETNPASARPILAPSARTAM